MFSHPIHPSQHFHWIWGDENYLATSSMVAGIGLSLVSERRQVRTSPQLDHVFQNGHLAGWRWWGRMWWPWSRRWGWGWSGWSPPTPPPSSTTCLPPSGRDSILLLWLELVKVKTGVLLKRESDKDTTTSLQSPLLQTLPKTQRTRGLSSYHKITVHSSQKLNILQFQNRG